MAAMELKSNTWTLASARTGRICSRKGGLSMAGTVTILTFFSRLRSKKFENVAKAPSDNACPRGESGSLLRYPLPAQFNHLRDELVHDHGISFPGRRLVQNCAQVNEVFRGDGGPGVRPGAGA